MESPSFNISFTHSPKVNWTATYRIDSDIVAPYGKWVYYDNAVKSRPNKRDYATGKSKLIAWFVSHCKTSNQRMKYAKMLDEYVNIDIFGDCGTLKCHGKPQCQQMLQKHYKFYLAFENSNCHQYVTEKLFDTALK